MVTRVTSSGPADLRQTGRSSRGGARREEAEDLYRDLGEVAKAIHQARFYEIMLKGLSEIVDWRACSVTRFSPNALPELLFQEGMDPTNFQLYLDGYYRLDPYYGLCQSGPASGVYSLRGDFSADMSNAYARAYMPLSGWRDDVAIFFPGMDGTSIGLFWDKSKPVRKSELLQLEALYPLLKGLHDAHLLAVTAPPRRSVSPSEAKAPITMDFAVSRFSSEPLTERETQILSLILSGYSNAEISKQLDIGVGAVRNHRVRLYKKLDVATERALIQLFVAHLTRIDTGA